MFFLNCNKVVFSEGQFFYRQDNPGAITKKLTYKSFDMAYTFFRLFEFLRDNSFAPELYAREALKSLRTLEQMQQWLSNVRMSLSAHELAEAEARSARCAVLLREHRFYEIFSPNSDIPMPTPTPTPTPLESTA